jgi:hypothetical protein
MIFATKCVRLGTWQDRATMEAFRASWDDCILRKPKRRLRKAQRELKRAMNGPMTG